MQKILRKLAAVATVATTVLALASCSPGSQAGGEEPQNLTLHLAAASPPGNFTIGNWTGGDATLFLSVYDTVIHQTLDGKLEGGVAKKWEYSDDKKTLTLSIRDGMKFTDRTPVNAEAVVASLRAAMAGASTKANLTSIASVEATDSSTVKVSLSRPDASLVPVLASVAGAVGAPAVLTAESSKLEPVGSGAYVLDKAKTTAGSVYTLTKNPDYWDAGAYPYGTVETKIIADATAVQNAMLSGQLDATSVSSAEEAKQYPESQFSSGPTPPAAVGGLFIVDRAGSVVPALADVRVRKAINLAIDRESIQKKLIGAERGATNQMVSPSGETFDKDLLSAYPFDVDKAKSLMAEAGYANGFAVTMPSTPISLRFESVLSQQLGAIGIKVKWESVPFQDFYAKVLGRSYGMFFMFNGLSGSDALDLNNNLTGVFNPFNATTPELDALRAAADAAPDAKQVSAFKAINKYLVEQAFYAPIIAGEGVYVVKKGIEFTPPVARGQNVLPFKPVSK
ncbi:ABC transporter substrate-binding protein [Arthrobacter sp. B2a2-09]|uniref:ABC transporter substrate-binding protein n=1 Tax=Arthrobacter sp. B2a2-09 TaxID=2952822 RepID=UPI0022CD84BE|nr:ABC transporter substrate-binding protein [Arthrobacter sp. B2a2-09]MCZ9882828.1 ABC transporter substrate-binding protein [Arthrobacter sp. B2a2-09]